MNLPRNDSVSAGARSRDTIGFLVLAALLLAGFLGIDAALGARPDPIGVTDDELWGATLAGLSLFKAIIFVLRFDIHPPLYYMQLNLWAWAGHSDRWLQLNSMAWLLLSSFTVAVLIRRRGSWLAALIGAGLTLSSPFLLEYGLIVRMYSFLAFLTLIGLAATERLIERIGPDGRAPHRHWLAVALPSLALIYSYATGPIIIIGHFTYGALGARRAGLPFRFYRNWLALHVGLALLALPVIANSLLRGAGHPVVPDAGIVVSGLTELAVGVPPGPFDARALATLIMLALAFAAAFISLPNARHLLIAYVILPILLVFGVSHALAPIWLTRSFLFAVPVFAVAIGRTLAFRLGRTQNRRRALPQAAAVLAAIALVFGQAMAGIDLANAGRVPDYRALSIAATRQLAPGDCLAAVQGLDQFWGIARTLGGPDWGDALAIQAAPSGRWVRIMAALPPSLAAWLSLTPRADRFEHDGVEIVSGYPKDLVETCRRVFVLGREPDLLDVPPPARTAPLIAGSDGVELRGPADLAAAAGPNQ